MFFSTETSLPDIDYKVTMSSLVHQEM